MVRSMLVVLVVVGLLLLVTWRPQPEAVKAVDYGPVLIRAQSEAEYPVLVPAGLGDGWRVTSARWEPTEESDPDPAWHLGYVTPDDQYLQVAQSATDRSSYVEEQTADGRPAGESDVDGTTWQRYESPDAQRRSLVTVVDGVTVVVSGTVDWDLLERVAGSLAEPAVTA